MHFTASVSARNPHFDIISVEPQVAERWAQTIKKDDPQLVQFVNNAVSLAQQEFSGQAAE